MTNKFETTFNSFFKNYQSSITLEKNDFVLETNIDQLQNVLFFLRDHEGCLFKTLIDILAIDYPEKEKRFSLIYCLLSVKYNVRIRVKVLLDELTSVPSIKSMNFNDPKIIKITKFIILVILIICKIMSTSLKISF